MARSMRLTGALALLVLGACGSDGGGASGTGGSGGTGGTGATAGLAGSSFGGAATGGTQSGGAAGTGGSAGAAPGKPTATLADRTFVCKLVNGASITDPTPNQTHTRFNLKGTDLGIPLVTGNDLHLFFGDTVGYKVIWDFGEDPDSVARIPLATVQADVSKLCSDLDFYVTPDVPSVANGADSTIQRDFASAYMTPPSGEPLSKYIAQPPPGFPNIPGTFEVPTGAIAQGGSAYLYYAGAVETSPRTRATLSYLARWSTPGSGGPGYQILRAVDSLVGGALGGHFIQVAPVAHGGFVHLFGTGDYRRSGIYLARVGEGSLDGGGGEELFDPAKNDWVPAASLSQAERDAILPVVETEGVGELSAQWVESAKLWLLMYQRELHDSGGNINDNRVIVRLSPDPRGPWSDPVTIVNMADPAFLAAHCCGTTCPGSQLLHCNKAGLYGAYALPLVTESAGALDVPFLVSTWDPYNVVLFRAKVTVTGGP